MMDGVNGLGVRFGLKAESAKGNCLDSSQVYNEWTGIEVRGIQMLYILMLILFPRPVVALHGWYVEQLMRLLICE
jgi:hypothetical protein